MKKSILGMMLATSLTGISSSSFADAFAAENFSANIAFTTNYLFRGVSLSDDEGAVSGGFDWGYNGFYLGTWASSIDPAEEETFEIDYYGGYTGEIGGVAYSLDYIYYDYPGEESGDLAYYEYGGSLGYTFGGDLEPTIGVLVLHSPEFYGNTDEATAIEASFGLTLPNDFAFGVYYGNQDLDEDKNGIDDYDYYGVTLSKAIGKFEITAGYSDTDSDGDTFNVPDNDTGEFYLTIGASI
jgi:uncharacterized protein (TIGR02001 family)